MQNSTGTGFRSTRARSVCQWILLLGTLLSLGTFVPGVTLFAAEPAPGVQVADDLTVTLYAGDDLAHDVHSLTVDSLGRVVVSGPGYVKILIDADRDGVADSTKTYVSNLPAGVQGMYFLGRDLICASGEGLVRYRDRDGDDQADGPPETFLKIRTGNEHDLHAIRKGPDGWWYLITGNSAGVTEKYAALPTSPVKKPSGGTLLRLKPDLSAGEVFAHGMRNAYDFDFSEFGDIFTFESDGENATSLPWYRPTRILQLLPGAHAGWVTNDWIRPDSFFDMPPVIRSMGRGSPTGVVTYRHTALPSRYHGALLVMDWTYGKVYALPLSPNGSTWSTEPIEIMSAVGQYGFAPTDLEVGPSGEIYVAVGGRGTRGGVYCIRPAEKNPDDRPWPGGTGIPSTTAEKLRVCLQAPQPLSSWSRRVWEPLAEQIRSEPFIMAAQDRRRPAAERIRAIEILTEKFNGIDRDLATQLTLATDPQVRARAAWAIGRSQPRTPNPTALTPFLTDPHPQVVRAALEALIGSDNVAIEELIQPLGEQLAHRDKFIRQTLMRILSRTSGTNTHKVAQVGFPRGWSAAIPVAGAYALAAEGFASYTVEVALNILEGSYEDSLKQEAVRVLQVGLGDLTPSNGQLAPVYDGYAPRLDLSSFAPQIAKVQRTLESVYPTGIAGVDWELERVISMIQPSSEILLEKVLQQLTRQSHPVADIHRLIVASRIPVKRTPEQRARIADTLIHLVSKIQALNLKQDSDWDQRILEMYDSLVELDSELPLAVLQNPEFGHPSHIQLIGKLPPQHLIRAGEIVGNLARSNPDYPWNADVVFLLAASPREEDQALIREKFSDYSLRSAVLVSLAQEPEERDRPLFLQGVENGSIDTMLACIGALQLLEPSKVPEENVLLVKTLRKLGDRDEERQARDQIVELLRLNLGENHGYILGRDGDPQREAITAWTNAVRQRFPKEFAASEGTEEEDLQKLYQRLARIPWERGNAQRGHQIFNVRACSSCHGQSRALGPSLDGVTGRFSKEDLFTAIVFPSRDVSPRYRATQILTTDGQVRTGMVFYEAVDAIALRDANNQTYRIPVEEIEARKTMTTSLMPNGLLNGLTDQDLADLYAYLQTVGQTATASGNINTLEQAR